MNWEKEEKSGTESLKKQSILARIISHLSPPTAHSCMQWLLCPLMLWSIFSFAYNHYKLRLFLWYLMMIWCANFLLAFGPSIASISLREIRMHFNETNGGYINFHIYIILFYLLKTRAKPDGNGRLADADTPKTAMKMETLWDTVKKKLTKREQVNESW